MNNSYNDFFQAAQKKKGLVKPAKNHSVKMKSEKINKQAPVKPKKISSSKGPLVSFLLAGFFMMGAGALFFEDMESFFNRIDIRLFGAALAEETPNAEKKESASGGGDATSPAGENVASQDAKGTSEGGGTTLEEGEGGNLAHLRERKKELDRREEELNKIEQELAAQRSEIEKKLEELEGVRRKISSVLEEKVQADDQKIENLVQFYSSMKAPQAAKIIETIDEDLAVKVMTRMKKKTAADIMNLLKPEKAQVLSEKYIGYRK